MSELIVETQAGKVRGIKARGYDGIEFSSFKGIPYAKPPVGELRFKDPQTLEPWTGVREATSHGPNCAQLTFHTKQIVGDDDCLYLNVYARHIDANSNWPVMVWIHGGAFVNGSGDDSLYGPDYFVRKDVVLVTVNYRLGIFGFLNLDDEVATGNQGLKDQVMALQWIRDNIAHFGGDPGNVTIFGESAGGASVHYLTLSPLAKGLFHKAISQSGAVTNSWAYFSNIKEKAHQLCEDLGFKEKDPKSIIRFLRTIDAHKLVVAQEKLDTTEAKAKFIFSFGPTIDSKSKNPFMPIHPAEAVTKGIEVPLIIGYTSREGFCFLNDVLDCRDKFNKKIDKILHPDAVDSIKKLYNLTPENFKRIYFHDDPITEDNLENLTDLVGDLYFVEGVHRVIKTQIQKNCAPTFFYQFTYDKEPSGCKLKSNIRMSGACHGDELEFLFRAHFYDDVSKPLNKDSDKYRISEQMIELWVNFATTGTPTPTESKLVPFRWQPVNDDAAFLYINICEKLRMDVALDIGQQYIARKYPDNNA